MATVIEMPKLSDTMTSGTLVRWLVKEGAEVSAGQMIAEVETDKATMEVECFEDGVLLKHYCKEGDAVAIGDPICAVGEKGESAPEAKASPAAAPVATSKEPEKKEDADAKSSQESKEKTEAKPEKSEPKEVAEDSVDPDAPLTNADGERIFVSPLAKRMAKDLGVDLNRVKGTGPNGRIVKVDVEQAAKNPPPAAIKATGQAPAVHAAFAETKTFPVTNMRAAISRALVASKTEAPHFYLQTEVDGAPLDKLRKQLNTHLADLPPEQGGVKLSVNDLILKAAAMAVLRVPAINRAWQGDKIIEHGTVHLAFGVAIDDGLVTPVIRDAQSKSLRTISGEAKELIGKARGKKLKPAEMSGSTLTVTNLGMYGITDFYGIINPPNAAILSVGATVKTPVVDDKGQITVGYRMKVGLSGDHRVIDGAVGAQYLAALREILETPALMLV